VVEVTFDQLSRGAQAILMQIGGLFAGLVDNIEILMYFLIANLFFAITGIFDAMP
jgi:hypothetical protein